VASRRRSASPREAQAR